MFGNFKRWLGFSEVKMRISALEVYPIDVNTINAELLFSAKGAASIEAIRLRLIERYERGRGDNKQIDEYILGEKLIEEPLHLENGQDFSLFFKLPFQFQLSNMDRLERSNVLGKSLAGFAKSLKSAKSTYRIEAVAQLQNQEGQLLEECKIRFQGK